MALRIGLLKSSALQNDRLDVKSIGGRDYDYIGWNSIEIRNDQNSPNRFFSNRNVRKALTHALDREEIVKVYLYDSGKLLHFILLDQQSSFLVA